jgi:hypothetical protein
LQTEMRSSCKIRRGAMLRLFFSGFFCKNKVK